MNNRILLLLSVLALIQVRQPAMANDIEPGKEFYTVIYAPKPIVLDGDLSEWSGVPVLADPKFAVVLGKEGTTAGKGGGGADGNYVLFEQYNGGTWTGPDDQTSAVQIVYDTDNVYFGFVVTDDYHENAANSAWNGDSIQLMIADAARTNNVALYNYALGGVEGSLGSVIVEHERGPGGDPVCNCPTEAVITRNATTHKTTYEIKLPMASLGLTTLKGGPQFGLGMAINDGDSGPGQNGQKGWGGLGAHAIVFGKTPQETALITLAKGNDIEPGKEYYTALRTTNTITIDGLLTEWTNAPVLADPKFAIILGKEGTTAGKGGGGADGNYVLFEQYNGGTWTGPDDQTSAVQVVYDADNVYFGFVVTDDYHENAANSAWNGDSIQLMIADAARTNNVALYNYALGGVEGALGSVIVEHERGPGGDPVCNCPTEAVITRDATNKKTRYEIKLPVASLGLTGPLTVGTQFGLGMAINDGDSGAGQNGQKGWGGLGAHAIVFGKTPQETALVTLGTTATGGDRLFLSAINPGVITFTFRANDKGASIVNPASAKLTIDGQAVTLTAGTKVGDATDFTYNRPSPFPAGNHTYAIEVRDGLGNIVTDSSSFLAKVVPILTAAYKAVSVDTNKAGFFWRVFQNEGAVPTDLASAELALIGQLRDAGGTLLPNLADSASVGAAAGPGTLDGTLVKFEIPTVINLNQSADGVAGAGTFAPDDQMPGIPGLNGLDDGIDAEIITFVQFPAGLITLGVNSDDGFRVQAGYINKPEDGLLVGQFEAPSTSLLQVFVQDAGVYPIRIVYQEGSAAANIELYSVKADGSTVLLNDVANGGLKAYRAGVAPNKPTTSPTFTVTAQVSAGQIEITWTEPGTVLQESTNVTSWADLPTATSPYRPTTTGRNAGYYRLKK